MYGSSEIRGPSQDPSESLQQTQHPKRLTPNDVWGKTCPICLKEHPTLSHVALHLRKIAVFALPKSIELDEDSTLGDRGSKTANIDDQETLSSLDTFETSDKGDMHEDEIDDDWEQWDSKTPRDAAYIEYDRQKDIEHLELKASSSLLDAGLEEGNPMLYRSESNNDRPAPVAISLGNISFYARVDPLEVRYQAQPAQHEIYSFWTPPIDRTGFIRRPGVLFHWLGGTMAVVETKDPVANSLNRLYSVAIVFTQNPDTPHLLVVPFDAQIEHPYRNNGGWQPLSFHHLRINNTQHTYSAVSAFGGRQHIAAPGSPHWMPQLLPRVYNYTSGSPRLQAGLIGSLPILLALAAFSAPPTVLAGVLTSCVRPRTWRPHQYKYPTGRK